jgi:cyclophilin family peptidyl-prolyl cis-trans isomerase
MKRLFVLFALLVVASLALTACGEDDPKPADTQVPIPTVAATVTGVASSSSAQDDAVMLSPGDDPRPPAGALDTSKTYTATFDTEAGEFKVLLFDDEAPLTVENFINLVTVGLYDGTMFHRVIPDFMAQGGDPRGTGGGGPGYRFRDEFDATLRHSKPGILSMANAGPNTNGSQFFIIFAPTPHLDGVHSVFGEVIEGMDSVFNISIRNPNTAQTPGDLINSITITES